ncbi:zinc ribbon domain-containing protein [Paenibacillus daejeonensis]|uniref:zinc ribbon domain-containing protein n=1 Tax=Paenibacillus daejeonensis TaxID=135193 RepID=UPI0003766A27|nr:zinc ribbon domain-containing protein [Paenibacillus daejeonensis]
MSFLDKVKSGLSEAGSKAKTAVEVNKLKMQQSAKQKEIEKHYQTIGRIVFLTAIERDTGELGEDYQPEVEAILELEEEVQALLKQIKVLTGEKDCICGQSVAVEVKFCPSCGHTFTEAE